jgi:ribose transport system ATP-binding protein
MSHIVLKAENISKAFPGVKALSNVSFELEAGEVHGLMGENGAGKSTFIKILTGAYSKDEGTIEIDGKTCHFTTPADSTAAGVAVIYQEFSQVNTLSVAENIFLGRYPMKHGVIDWRRMYEEAGALLSRFGITADARHPLDSLGVSTRQMVEILKALKDTGIKILIMDEPTAALSDSDTERLFEFIRALKREGVAIIYISHRLNEISRICDRVTVFRNGERISTLATENLDVEEIVAMMLGRKLAALYPPKCLAQGPTSLKVTDLLADRVNGISFEVHQGEILGIAGLVGAGKTETLQTLFGANQKRGGSISVHGRAVAFGSPRAAIAAGLALIPESRKEQGLVLGLNVLMNTSLASLKRIGLPFLNLWREREEAAKKIGELDVKTPGLDALVLNLSGGNQQKVVLAKWLMQGSRILLFDEPTRGVDVGAKFQIYALIVELAKAGATVVIASSEVEEIAGICHRVLVMHSGKITCEVAGESLTTENILVKMTSGHGGAA